MELVRESYDKIDPIPKAIFDCSFDTGIIPNNWRMANMKPIFKKGGQLQPSKYWPI